MLLLPYVPVPCNHPSTLRRGGRIQPAVAVVPKQELAAALVQPVKTEPSTDTKEQDEEVGEEEGDDEEPSWPPPGIKIISSPDGDSPGSYM